MATIELSNSQLRLVQNALELYSRIGILQLEHMLYHPTIDSCITQQFTPKKNIEVGDKTTRGDVVKIGKGWIKTEGHWGNGKETRKWTDVENVDLSPDWSKVHETNDLIKRYLGEIKSMITGSLNYRNGNASFGIHNKDVDDSCRVAYDIIQIIRHEFWKANPNRSNITVDSGVHITSNNFTTVKVNLDPT
jgi:hypothetical protein